MSIVCTVCTPSSRRSCPQFLPQPDVCVAQMCLELTFEIDKPTRRLFPEKAGSPSLGSHQFPVALQLVVKPWENTPAYVGMSMDTVCVLLRQPYC